ncbi:MAG: FAD-dependent thymidylate synthase [Thermodesulfobacteriota bacterium]
MDQETLSEEIKKYVSNIDKDIYTVSNIPEEVIAVIFAYVSRSSKGFRENIDVVIREEQLGKERASKFHEKWVLNYGHASVAEHAAVHVGIEKVSRLFSSVLELSNEYLSFTEYSQRYQRPKKGDNYIPEELSSNEVLKNEFTQLCNFQYDLYTKLNNELLNYLKNKYPADKEEDENRHILALEKIAFEDARYALNISTFTNLGMTANARAIEDSISTLLSSKYPEVRKRALEMKNEVRFSVPTLVKYANENDYIVNTRNEFTHKNLNNRSNVMNGSQVNLLDYTGKGNENPEHEAIRKIVSALFFQYSESNLSDIENELSIEMNELISLFKKAVDGLSKYDNPNNVFKLVKYEAEFVLSEANWHQLLRHRKVNWIVKDPSIANGITVPPHIRESNTEDLLMEAIKRSEQLYNMLNDKGYETAAHYAVTNAHNRKVIGDFDLWELYHLINLRMSEGAQWDIKKLISDLARQVGNVHPNLVNPALKRVS